MEWINSLFFNQTALQAVIVIFLIIAAGLLIGRIKIGDISLGAASVFFCGIFAGHAGLEIDSRMMAFAENFGLIIFVYALGLQVGPGFFNSFRKGGMRLNILGIGVVLSGTALALLLSLLTPISIPDMVGILCGATTNTPALGAAQQTLQQLGLPSSTPALGCAVAYPFGVVGVILAMVLIRRLVVGRKEIDSSGGGNDDSTYIATFKVHNPEIYGKTVMEVARMIPDHFIITRLWHSGEVCIPDSSTRLEKDDRILVVSAAEEVVPLTRIFGEIEQTDWNKKGIDWNKIDRQLISNRIIVTRPEINGKTIGSLRLRNRFGVNITRVFRSGYLFLATPDLILQTGDRLVVVGREDGIAGVEKLLGNAVRELREPNLISICVGVIIGLAIGAIPLMLPGISTPVKLGIAGGPIIAGLLMGAFGPRIHMITYTTESANLMLRRLGLSMYLACLGLDAGGQFFETVFRPEGLLWIGTGFAITLIPVILVGIFALKVSRLDFGTVCGMLCGSMANPMALTYATDSVSNEHPALSYTTVYPLCMFLRVIIAQLLPIFFI